MKRMVRRSIRAVGGVAAGVALGAAALVMAGCPARPTETPEERAARQAAAAKVIPVVRDLFADDPEAVLRGLNAARELTPEVVAQVRAEHTGDFDLAEVLIDGQVIGLQSRTPRAEGAPLPMRAALDRLPAERMTETVLAVDRLMLAMLKGTATPREGAMERAKAKQFNWGETNGAYSWIAATRQLVLDRIKDPAIRAENDLDAKQALMTRIVRKGELVRPGEGLK